MHIYCHPSSILSFMTPSLGSGLISCESTAQEGKEGNRVVAVMLWQWGVPSSEWQPLSLAAFADGCSTVTVCAKAGCLWPLAK